MMPFAPIIPAEDELGPRGKYRKTVQTRARILEAALAVFGEQGFEAGSLREVAERAGISQAGLLHHFPSKVAVLSAVLQRRDERAAAGVDGLDGIHQLASALDFARASAEVPFEIDLFAVLSAEATRAEHPANSYMRRRYHWVSEIFVNGLLQAREAGHLQDWVDPAETASQFIALWDGLQLQWLLQVGDVNVADRLEKFLDLHLVRPLAELLEETDAAARVSAAVTGAS